MTNQSRVHHIIYTMLTPYYQVHAHWATYPTLAASSKAYIDIMNGIGWLLGQKVDSDETIAKAVEYAGAG